MPTRQLLKCLCCGGENLVKYLDLGMQPPPNAFSIKPQTIPKYVLEVNICTQCFHSQLSVVVDHKILFTNYMNQPDSWGWPDTETTFSWIMDKHGVKMLFLGRETNYENQETEHWLHARSLYQKQEERHLLALNFARETVQKFNL